MEQKYVIAIDHSRKEEEILVKRFASEEEAERFVRGLNEMLKKEHAHAYVRDVF